MNSTAENRSFHFLEIIMAVILGALLVGTPESVLVDLSIHNFRAILLVLGLFIFLEMYIVLARYHLDLKVPYPPMLLFADLGIGLLFLLFVELLKQSWQQPRFVGLAVGLVVIILALIFLRQWYNYRQVDGLDARVETLPFQAKDLKIPLYVQGGSMLICICMYVAQVRGTFLAIALPGWSQISLGAFLFYFVAIYLFKVQPRKGL